MTLLIVESPTKARTIKKFLPKGYEVTSSFGHMRDLPKSEMGIDVERDFEPKYIIPRDKQKNVTALKKLATKANEIILASDEDREGEAIAWHLRHIIENNSKRPPKKKPIFKRIVFHEITKSAIEKALEKPRELDTGLINAQQARRVLDRLVGYELSPFLWKKIRRGLSAGRVQSVALRFIVEREKERADFKKKQFYSLRAELFSQNPSEVFEAKLTEKNGTRVEKIEKMPVFAGTYSVSSSLIETEEEARDIQKDLEQASYSVSTLEKKETKRTPPPPFTTSTLQQSAINRLGFSSKQTMRLAQNLYEQGHITYMRTDSVNLSLESTLVAKKVIEKTYGKQYALPSPRHYKTKSKGAQEAHEAIRPTYPDKTPETLASSLDARELKLYRLIWERMMASQATQAVIDSVRVDIVAKGKKDVYTLHASGSSIQFDGYLAISGASSQLSQTTLPPLKEKDILNPKIIHADKKETSPPPRYSEASLVKVLEEREIGRPSTYAPTISTLFDRGYIDRDENKKLFPQEVGTLVCDMLSEHFSTIVDIDFTATLENALDAVAEGKQEWIPVVRDFYVPFHKNLEKKIKNVKKEEALKPVGKNCPDCGSELVERFGRFGKFVGCSNFPECKFIEKTKKEEISSGVSCPTCKEGDLVMRRTRRGKVFYGCNRFPKCKTAYWDKPTGNSCDKCSSMLVENLKGEVKCSNKECDKK